MVHALSQISGGVAFPPSMCKTLHMAKQSERVWLIEKPELTARSVHATRQDAEQTVTADPDLAGAIVRSWHVHGAQQKEN